MLLTNLIPFALLITPGLAQRNRDDPWRNRDQPQQPQQPAPAKPPAPTQSLWGQCGGRTYTGVRACPGGAYCRNDGNEWYEQCVPNGYTDFDHTGGGAQPPPGNPNIITRTITTIFTVPGPQPSRVSTYITFLTPAPQPVKTITVTADTPYRPWGDTEDSDV